MKIISTRAKFCYPIDRTDKRKDRRTDWQTNLTKLIVAFLNFAKAPENRKKVVTSNLCK